MKITPQEKTVQTILSSHFFAVPRFQRAYSWSQEHVDDFWSDVVDSADPDYFIGSCVFFTKKNDPNKLFIVDGQQRLTTIAIILSILRDKYLELGHAGKAGAAHRFVINKNLNNEDDVVVTRASTDWLVENVQKQIKVPGVPTSTEENALSDAAVSYRQKFDEIAPKSSPITSIAVLDRVRDKVLGLKLISIELDDQDDAYVIFETLNSRGEDLRVIDMVKNLVMRNVKQTLASQDKASKKWTEILIRLEGIEGALDANRFIHHAWLSRYDYTTEQNLYREVKKSISQKDTERHLNDLVEDSKLYVQVMSPDTVVWTTSEREIGELLGAIRSYRVLQSAPTLLSILRAKQTKRATLAQLKDALSVLERFHFQFSAVAQKRTGGGTARMFSNAAKAFHLVNDKNGFAQELKALKVKLQSKMPTHAEFAAGFVDLSFGNTNRKQRAVVWQALKVVDGFSRKQAGLALPNYANCDIEHLASQSGIGHAIDSVAIEEIGNLLILERSVHDLVDTKAPIDKLLLLRARADVSLDQTLDTCIGFDAATIHQRSSALAVLVQGATTI